MNNNISWLPPLWKACDLVPEQIYSKKGFARNLSEIQSWSKDYWKNFAINPYLKNYSPPKLSVKHALVLGGNGFLGAEICADLIRKGWHVTVVARNPANIYKQWNLQCDKEELSRHLSLIKADLGSDNTDWILNLPFCDTVIHTAAQVHATSSFSSLQNANIGSIWPAMMVCLRDYAALNFISTLSTWVSSNQAALAEEKPLQASQDWWLWGGYAQTKAAAEFVMQEAGINTSVLRLGLLLPKKQQPISSNHTFRLFLSGINQLGILPEQAEQAEVDITIVDEAARIAVEIATNNHQGVYHWANPKALKLSKLIEQWKIWRVKNSLFMPEIRSKEQWLAQLSVLPRFEQVLLKSAFFKSDFLAQEAKYSPVLNVDLFQATNKKFSIENTIKLGFNYPVKGKILCESVIHYCLS